MIKATQLHVSFILMDRIHFSPPTKCYFDLSWIESQIVWLNTTFNSDPSQHGQFWSSMPHQWLIFVGVTRCGPHQCKYGRTGWPLTQQVLHIHLASNKAYGSEFMMWAMYQGIIFVNYFRSISYWHTWVCVMIRHCQYIYVTNWPHIYRQGFSKYIRVLLSTHQGKSRTCPSLAPAALTFSGEPQIDFESLWKSGAI